MKKIIVIAVLTALSLCLYGADKISSPIIKAGDNVAFVGDSITHGGHSSEYIMLYYITRYPDMRVKFLNLGVGGDSASGLLRRMDSEILKTEPKVAFLMIGMNDCSRWLYSLDSKQTAEEKEKNIKQANKNYRSNLAKVIEILSKNTRSVVLFTPSIYDQTAKVKTPPCLGVNDTLKLYGEYGSEIAQSYPNVLVADIWSELQRVNSMMQKDDPYSTIIGSDRVHPASAGGFVMAYKYLTDAKENPTVSKVSIIAGEKPKVALLENCDVSDLKSVDGGVSFKILEFALPMVVSGRTLDGESRTDFQENLNREILKVCGLANGDYELRIDGKSVGRYSASELSVGINLAGNDKTPQYAQAVKIAEICSEIRGKYASQRNLYFVEHFLLKDIKDFSDVQKCVSAARAILDRGKIYGWGKFAVEFYIENKAKEKQMLDEVFALQGDAYDAAETKTRTYEILPVK